MKDKNSERNFSPVLLEEVQRSPNVANKNVWTKFGGGPKDKGGSFVPARVKK